ncbi:hypothetical protein FJT64_022551 [Amphibalanus amphitrite]|uniref:Uncharacterized protein n=1 Tax=Amphibalanus amphitrite TaxID=1232801 RepID=A0A6A4WQC2_AMPAM|nr:hypothetical protein FJT64_022551 [Amphibalanus amphitrite]
MKRPRQPDRTLERFLVEGGGWSLAGAMSGEQAGKLQRIRRLTEQPTRGTAEKPAGAAAAWWLRVRAVIVAVFAVLFLTQAYNPFFVLGLDRNIEIPLGKSIKLELMVEMSKYLNGYGHMCREEPGYTYVGCLRFCFEEKLIEAGPRCNMIGEVGGTLGFLLGLSLLSILDLLADGVKWLNNWRIRRKGLAARLLVVRAKF